MELARHRALTPSQVLQNKLFRLYVEMELARHRALTHNANIAPLISLAVVEMELARHRALTQLIPSLSGQSHPSRNGVSPPQGIDTTNVAITSNNPSS